MLHFRLKSRQRRRTKAPFSIPESTFQSAHCWPRLPRIPRRLAALNKSQEGKTIARNCWRTRSWDRGEGRSQRCQLSSQNRPGLMSKREAGFLLKGRFHQVRTRPSHSNDGGTLVQYLWQGRLAVLTVELKSARTLGY